jgi:hypothetical protein
VVIWKIPQFSDSERTLKNAGSLNSRKLNLPFLKGRILLGEDRDPGQEEESHGGERSGDGWQVRHRFSG